MIKIKEISNNHGGLFDLFYNFCIQSKPYDFCKLKSSSLRTLKIKEYFDELVNNSIIYSCYNNDDWIGFVFFTNHNDYLMMEFVFGNSRYNSSFLIKCFHEILILAQKTFDKQCVKSIIQRKYKKQNFINWIKRYDKVCKINQSQEKIEIIWKHERLS